MACMEGELEVGGGEALFARAELSLKRGRKVGMGEERWQVAGGWWLVAGGWGMEGGVRSEE